LVQDSANGLKQAGITMTKLAQEAKGANETADAAMNHTRDARQAVSTTVNGIDQIREIIRETEKRIKRLGERSQEITGAVNLINTIAERTHILALNASMHAASAGEAGRGFAVVADEVQRLAESSREATSDISSMVNAIRVETADTVDTMNRVIAQVAEGTRLAQQAGARMEETETTTAELVAAVAEIARAAEQQARSALELMERSEEIVQTTQQTSQQLEEQSAHTVQLVTFSNTLRESVGVFKLPAAAA
jgi:twitching motility protein PilJ